MTERSLRQPSGIRGKGFDGPTHGMREYLKYGSCKEGPLNFEGIASRAGRWGPVDLREAWRWAPLADREAWE